MTILQHKLEHMTISHGIRVLKPLRSQTVDKAQNVMAENVFVKIKGLENIRTVNY